MSVLLSIFKQPVLCGFFMVVASCCFISKNFSSFSYSVITIVAMQTLDKLCVSNKKKDKVLNQLSATAMNLKENALSIRFKTAFKNSLHHLSAIVVFLPRPWEICKG